MVDKQKQNRNNNKNHSNKLKKKNRHKREGQARASRSFADISVNDLYEFNKVHVCLLLLLCLMQLLMFSLRSVSFAMLVYVIICTMMSLMDRSFICQHKHLLIKFMCLFCTLSFIMILDELVFVYCTSFGVS